jgi:hypothetical protein
MPVWVYQVVEVLDRRERPLGRYRMVRWPDNDPGHVCSVCDHAHATVEEALSCRVVNDVLDYEFRERLASQPTLKQ